ncbi:MAG: transporter [Verrucomicrobiales bacterium]
MTDPTRRIIAATAGSLLAAGWLAAGENPPPPTARTDKSRFTLWEPVPRPLMREMSTDRPDQTESPYTVDAGHVQIELDFFNYTRSRDEGVKEWNIAPINVKVGLSHNVDVQLIFGGWVHQKAAFPGLGANSAEGIGDLTLRLKINLWGNDGGDTAFGLMPFVKLPLRSDDIGNNEVEGGLIVPFAWKPGGVWSVGLMTEVDVVANDPGGGHHLEWLNSATVGIDVTERIGAYVELVSVLAEAEGWSAQFDAGITFALTENVQLDVGCNFGLAGAVPDYQPFVGMSVRF